MLVDQCAVAFVAKKKFLKHFTIIQDLVFVQHVIFACRYVVHANKLRPYHNQRMQKLLPEDIQQRVNFCADIVVIDFFIFGLLLAYI